MFTLELSSVVKIKCSHTGFFSLVRSLVSDLTLFKFRKQEKYRTQSTLPLSVRGKEGKEFKFVNSLVCVYYCSPSVLYHVT